MSKDTGGPAFPVTPTDKSGQIAPTELGLSVRDYFAAKALSHALDLYEATNKANTTFAVIKAYDIADAMLAERSLVAIDAAKAPTKPTMEEIERLAGDVSLALSALLAAIRAYGEL